MKKVFNNPFFTFVIGLLIASIGTAYATLSYASKDVTFAPNNMEEWEARDVETALNDLYSINITNLGIINGVDLIENKSQSLSSYSFKPSNQYKYYILTNVWYSASNAAYETLLGYTKITSMQNATYIESGATGRASGTSVGAARSYIIRPDGSGSDVSMTFSYTSDALCLYGVK